MKTLRIPLLVSALALALGPPAHASVHGERSDMLRTADRLARETLRGLQLSRASGACSFTADVLAQAGIRGVQEDLYIAFGNCLNLTGPTQSQCFAQAWQDFADGLDDVADAYQARLDLCGLLGEAPYDPDIDPSLFVQGVDNPLLPFVEGNTWTYESMTPEGLERIVVTVTDQTKDILDVECIVVMDTVTLDGELVEDTRDYYAQDVFGNVWYFGELALNYEDGELTDIDGSWIAGEDSAKPGIVMYAAPVVGTTYRQEYLLDEAEDAATILADDALVTVPFGTFMNCLQTEDYTPLEPDVLENKYYAPGVGTVLEEDPDTGERVELVDFQPGS